MKHYFSKFLPVNSGTTLLTLCLLLAIGTGCNTTRFLDKERGEMFLVANEIVFEKADGKVKNKSNLEYELLQIALQKPNKKFFGVPRQYFYYTATDTLDKTPFGLSGERVKKRLLAEEPAILDTALVEQSVDIMRAHLQNKGYFFAKVWSEISVNRKKTKATVKYHVQPDGRFTIDSVWYVSKDTAIKELLDSVKHLSFLQPGSPIDKNLYQQEVSRITTFLRDNGYAYFYPQYISNLQGRDSSNTLLTADIELEILLPPGKEKHQVYHIGEIYIDPDFDPYTGNAYKQDTVINGIHFLLGKNERFKVKPKTILNSLFFEPGSLYRQSEIDNSVRQLSGLGVFRPPSFRFEEDSIETGKLNFTILLTPNKKWEIGADFDISTTERKNLGSSDLLGLSFSPSLRNRNFLRGAELFAFNTDLGIELAFPSGFRSLINTVDFRLQADLYLPRFTNYFGIWKGLWKSGILSEHAYQEMRQKATSRFSSSYNLLILLDNYRLQFANITYGFDFQKSLNNRYLINHMGFDLLVPEVTPNSRFDTLLQGQPLLRNSFSRQFISGILFRDLTWIHTSSTSSNANYWYFRGTVDLSGLEAMAGNSLVKLVANTNNDLQFFGIDFSHYLKLETDLRHNWVFSPNRQLVARANVGFATPYYQSSTVPYVKQFYVGGPYSLRGWYARSLGPGLYKDPLTDDRTQRNLFYQSGDIKIEFNLEYRFLLMRPANLFNLYGAVFIDAGNVWTRKEDEGRPGSQFAFTRRFQDGAIVQDNFLREMAVGSGFGTRWDFTYFILRLDLGVPLRNNYPDSSRSNTYWNEFSKLGFKDVIFNLGLGYPF
ncbi:MAG: BamA/TamA family outer membrane protein [Saprospiraceae bacterium]